MSSSYGQYSLFPLDPKYQIIYKLYKTEQNAHWIAEEVDLTRDKKEFDRLDKDEKHFIKAILVYFSVIDGVISANLTDRFSQDINFKEGKIAWTYQAMMENVHNEMYALLVRAYMDTEEERNNLFEEIERMPAIKKKVDWAIKWVDSPESFIIRLFAFILIEGLHLSSSFCGIDWTRERGMKLDGLHQANTFIRRDEWQHTWRAIVLLNLQDEKLDEETAIKMTVEAVDIEKEFITESIPVSMIGMNVDSMSQYVEYIADLILELCNFKKIYNKENPFPFMDLSQLDCKENFFEVVPTNYTRGIEIVDNDIVFNVDDLDL